MAHDSAEYSKAESAVEVLRRLAAKRKASATIPQPSRLAGRIRGPVRARAGRRFMA